MLFNIFLAVATFFAMEGMAWFTHKYVMHGILWSWHRSHHTHHNHVLEMNDLFAVVFAVVSVSSFALGRWAEGFEFMTWIGLGILGYGIFYFIFHDVIVHRRIRIKYKAKSSYMKRLIRAHYVHHTVHTKEGAEAFGFLYAPKKYESGKAEV
jgi:beta-carotene 3-hydroxylase